MHKLDLKKKKEDIWKREFSSPIWFIYKRIKIKKSGQDRYNAPPKKTKNNSAEVETKAL